MSKGSSDVGKVPESSEMRGFAAEQSVSETDGKFDNSSTNILEVSY